MREFDMRSHLIAALEEEFGGDMDVSELEPLQSSHDTLFVRQYRLEQSPAGRGQVTRTHQFLIMNCFSEDDPVDYGRFAQIQERLLSCLQSIGTETGPVSARTIRCEIQGRWLVCRAEYLVHMRLEQPETKLMETLDLSKNLKEE